MAELRSKWSATISKTAENLSKAGWSWSRRLKLIRERLNEAKGNFPSFVEFSGGGVTQLRMLAAMSSFFQWRVIR